MKGLRKEVNKKLYRGTINGEKDIVWKDGAVYEGHCLNYQFFGEGKYTFLDGRYFVGSF